MPFTTCTNPIIPFILGGSPVPELSFLPAPHIGAEPGRAKGESLLSRARVQPLCGGGGGGGRKESSGTGLLGGLFALKQSISCSLKHDTVPRVNNLYCFM